MKKSFAILVSILLVLFGSIAIYAKGSVGLSLNYGIKNYSYIYPSTDGINDYAVAINFEEKAFNIGIPFDYYISNAFSISATLDLSFFSGKGIELIFDIANSQYPIDSTYYNSKYFQGDLDLFARYDLLNFGIGQAGVQVGFMESVAVINSGFVCNAFFIGLGLYGNVRFANNFNFYIDSKFPIGFFLKYGNGFDEEDGFFKGFFIDVTLGLSYDITSNINIGITANWDTSNVDGAIHQILYSDGFPSELSVFRIGAKIGYTF